MIFLTPHVYYGDDNAVSPDDFFGKEVNRILDKYNIDKKDREIFTKSNRDSTGNATVADSTVAASDENAGKKEKRKFGWFVRRKAR